MKNFSLLSLKAFVADRYDHAKSMKTFLLAIVLCSISFTGFATVIVTPASGGTGICPNLAVGGGAPAFTTLGTITITEGTASDFSGGIDVLTLTLPSGWQFNTSALPVLTFTGGGDITGLDLSGGGFTNDTSFSIDISTSGMVNLDQFTISGLQVQANSGISAPGYIYSTLAGGVFGVTTGAAGTNFGGISLVTGVTPAVSITASPSGPICTGTGVTFTPEPTNGGPSPVYQWYVNGIFITTGNTFSISTLSNGDEVTCVLVSSLTCSFGTSVTSNTIAMSVTPLPNVYSISTGGAYCAAGSGVDITLLGSDGGVDYQLYYLGSPVGGIVAGTGGVVDFGPQTGAGTYTVVASNATTSGCTVDMSGTATVTITAGPPSFTVEGGGSYCLGSGGVDVNLNSSVTTDSYQLLVDGSATGATMPGSGSAIDFGTQTTAGTYTVIATDLTTGCTGTMTGSVAVAINPLPLSFAVTGGGSFCTGGTGVDVALSSSESTASYQLFDDGAAVSPVLAGTGGIVDFGPQTAAGTYTIIGTYSATGCSGTVGTTTVSINPLPTVYGVLGGGTYCSGGAGIDVSITGSDINVNYQLYRALVAVGAVVAGTGSPLDFGSQTSAGDYTVVAIDAVSGCTSNMTGDALVTVSPLPEAFGVIGGGATCAGGFGINVSQVGSVLGVNYQLYLGGVPVGGPVPGTGGFLSYGAETGAGTYTAIGTDATSGCSSAMQDSAVVSLIPAPNAYTVTGGTIGYCVGGTGVIVGLSSSDIGVNYQLFLGGTTTVGGLVAGTGGAITFGIQTTAGTYTVIATNATTFCDNNMIGSAIISINPLPTQFAMAGGANYCVGGTGADVSLTGSTAGVKYQLFLGSTATGTAIAGTGAALDFGLQTGVGTYTAVATDTITGCTSNMTGTAVVDTISLPHAYTVMGGGSYCTGGLGDSVTLNSSDVGVSYQLYNLFTPVGAVVVGTGSSLNFGLQTASGFYTVVGTNTTTLCTSNMSGGVAITILPLPTVYNVFGGGSYCVGGAGVDISLNGSVPGINYQLFDTTAMIGTAVAGMGSVLDFGNQTAAGTYTVVATDATSLCTSNMADSAVVVVSTLPNLFTVSGAGAICAGSGAGVDVTLSGSQTGLYYQLYDGTTAVGAAILSTTGSLIDFGFQTLAGTYTVVATNAASTCTGSMTGTATVTVNPAPTAYPIIGGGAYCTGGAGLHVGLSASDLGVSYQLFFSGTPTGITLSGTGGALDFGPQTASGAYTVSGTNPTTGCTGNMSGSAIIAISPLPTAYAMGGGGNYCSGAAGSDVYLASSDFGVNYQLYLDGTPVGGIVSGTGLLLDFGFLTAIGTYTAIGTNAAAGCTTSMLDSSVVTVSLPPNVYSISGGGSSCTGSVAFDISLLGSDATATYQLYNGSVPVGAVMSGTGSSLDFGTYSVAGTYTIIATDATTHCTSSMSGTAVIAVVGYPLVDAISGAASICQFSTTTLTDFTISGTWSSSALGIATVTGGTVTGVSAGTATISYTVTNSTGCATTVTTNITVLAAPSVPGITGTANTCVGLSDLLSDATSGGVWSSSNTGVAFASTDGTISGVAVGSATISYTVTDPGGCSAVATLPFTVGTPIPASAILPLYSATICGGNPVDLNVVITGGISGYTFQWFDSGIAIPSAVVDTYVAFTPGMYTVEVMNSGCSLLLTDTTDVLPPPNPVISYDTAAGLLFVGSFSTFQWFMNDTTIVGATTNNLPYGTPGSYTVLVSDTNGCYDTSLPFIILVDTNVYVNPITSGKDVRIYPNPATSVLNIDAPVKVWVTIATLEGKIIIDRKEAISVNVSDLADGMYMIMVYDENNNLMKTEKFVKMQ